MTARWATGGSMDKRKVCVFLILVVIGLLCVLLMAYALFYARPHNDPTIEKDGHSSLRSELPTAVRS
jgi:hypothetical protein